MTRWPVPLLCACLWLAPLCVPGQTDADEIELDDDAIELDAAESGEDEEAEDEIDLGSAEVLGQRTLASALDDTRAMTVIDAAAFAGAVSVSDVLERVEGVDIRRLGGQGQLSTVQLRGARSEQVLVLVDGAPLAPEVADLSLIPLGALARVEVLRGPAAARFGSGALGGVVNLVTVQPQGADRSAVADATPLPLNEHLGQLLATPAADDGTTLTELTLSAGGFSAAEAQLSVAAPAEQYYLSHQQARNDFSYQRIAGGTGTRANNEASAQSFWAAWQRGGFRHRLGLTHQRRGVPGSVEFPTLGARLARDSLWWQTAAADWRVDGSVVHTHFSDPEPVLLQGAIDTRDTRAHLEAAWGSLAGQQGQWGLKPRLDYIDGDEVGAESRAGLDAHYYWERRCGRATFGIDTGLVASSDVAIDPVGHLGAAYELNQNAQAYTAIGYAVRHPGFNELYYPDTGGVRGNPELDAERLLSFELGIGWTGARARCELAGFFSDYRDSIIWAPVSAYSVQSINTGPAEIAGAEALLDVQLSGPLWWRTAFTWLPHAQFDSGVPLTGRSARHLNSRLEYTGGADSPWRAALSVDYTDEIPADLFGSLMIEPRTLVGIELAREFGAGELGLTVTNIFDEQARDAWNYPQPGRGIYITWRTEL